MKLLGLLLASLSVVGSATVANAGHGARDEACDRYYRPGLAAMRLPAPCGGGVEAEYGPRQAAADYTQLPDVERDAAIWSVVQQALEEHLDYAFSLSSRSRGSYLPVGREISAAEVMQIEAQRAPRYFSKADEADRDTRPPTQPAAPASRPAAGGQIEIKGGRAGTPPAVERGAIQIIPKRTARPSDKQLSTVR